MQNPYSVSHIGIAVADMRTAAARFEAPGFVLTPFAAHARARQPGDPVTKPGGGNRCAVFGRNDPEIVASEHADQPGERIA